MLRFPDGFEILVDRQMFAIRKHGQRDAVRPTISQNTDTLYDYVIYRCVVGSRAYGLERADSDTDRRSIYLPPAELHWSLGGAPEQLENESTQEVYWELQKFLELALKANPNVLECLYSPMIESSSPLADELLSIRSAFLSQLIYQTYNGYVMSQFKKLEHELHTPRGIKWKHAMHLIRLLLSGISVLREGFVQVNVEGYREQLLTIRNGAMPWSAIDQWRLRLHAEFDAVLRSTHLPEAPDYETVNAFLVRARRSMVGQKEHHNAT